MIKYSPQMSKKSSRIDVQNSRNISKNEQESGEAMEMANDGDKLFKSLSKYSTPDKVSETDSFIPFSQRTSITHIPTIYEELIQKYENDIRNHIRIEQQMKLHSDSVISKLEDKEKQFDKTFMKFKETEDHLKSEVDKFRLEMKVLKEENEALKNALEKKIDRMLNIEVKLKETTANYSKLELDYTKLKHR